MCRKISAPTLPCHTFTLQVPYIVCWLLTTLVLEHLRYCCSYISKNSRFFTIVFLNRFAILDALSPIYLVFVKDNHNYNTNCKYQILIHIDTICPMPSHGI
jgi:hypothetical protein